MSIACVMCQSCCFLQEEYRYMEEERRVVIQAYDMLLSNPHISGLGMIGAAAIGSLGENSAIFSLKDEIKTQYSFRLCAQRDKVAVFADLFPNVSFSAQHGNFERLILDLTRLNARLDIPSGSSFVSGAVSLAETFYTSQRLDPKAIYAVCPDLTVSLQQQIIGTLSFRVDSKIKLDKKNEEHSVRFDETVFAINWAWKVLGSAKAAKAAFWYAPKHEEAMVELLSFFES